MKRVALILALAALATVPLWITNSYYVNVTTQILISAIFALGLNVLVGYGGLVSLGHAGLFGFTCYACGWLINAGVGQLPSAIAAILLTVALAGVFAALSLRATGITFLMITLALGQIMWGIAYRWISVTGGDNGLSVSARPAPFGLSLEDPVPFYYATLIAFLVVVVAMYAFVHSPLGASLRATRDQPRRMTTLGYHVWMIRFLAFLVSGLVVAIAGLFFFYYNKFVSPYALSLTTSAETLLMVIAGGTGTLLGPIVGAALVVIVKYVVSAYVERWNMVLGAIFVAIVLFMPEGLVPGSTRLVRRAYGYLRARRSRAKPVAQGEGGP
ncbi:MAG TPA: branched-chain amino acid ABC transporter permease [Alphaproteobacteria bacterium]|nr:branched-chain amino acid ABC transporter permease [Alphaproteobacteria bacterium]